MSIVITAKRLLRSSEIVDHPVVVIDDGRITSICTRESTALPFTGTAGVTLHEFPEATLVPSYLDIHVHGAAGHDFMKGGPEALHAVEVFLASHGVGAFLPTTVTSSEEETLAALDRLATEIERGGPPDGAVPIGIHLEGPFLAHTKRGVHPAHLLAKPTVPLFERYWSAARGHIRLLTIAPELEGSVELIQHASALGVRCSLGHSDATAEQGGKGFRAGARSATHTFNAMRGLGHREPGLAGYVLDNDDLFAEIICDGIHVDPAIVRLFFKAKGRERAILITDGISATGEPDGQYKLGDLEVSVKDGRCTLAAQPETLAGSVLTVDDAVRNFSIFTGEEIPMSVALATRNPAKLLDIEHEWGVLEEGREANIAVLSASGEVVQSFRAGRPLPGL
jgi:N-acetylglucosamine-6-phosphate deacetylase